MTAVDETFWWAHCCLNGEIAPGMRMVVLRIDAKRVTFRYYNDSKENSFLRERAEIVAVNFDSGLSTKLDALVIVFVHSTELFGKLECFDGVLFRRWDNDQCSTAPDD